MQPDIEIRNGSGWNNYTALRNLRSLPRGTATLAKKNGIARIAVAPTHSEKPLGIAVRYYDAAGEEKFAQLFDQNDSAEWIRRRVITLLEKGICVQIEALRLAAQQKAERIAKNAGFDSAASHEQARLKKAELEKAAAREARQRMLEDLDAANQAWTDTLDALSKGATTLTRKGRFMNALDVCVGEVSRECLYAWLHQNGHHVGVDSRMSLFHSGQKAMPA